MSSFLHILPKSSCLELSPNWHVSFPITSLFFVHCQIFESSFTLEERLFLLCKARVSSFAQSRVPHFAFYPPTVASPHQSASPSHQLSPHQTMQIASAFIASRLYSHAKLGATLTELLHWKSWKKYKCLKLLLSILQQVYLHAIIVMIFEHRGTVLHDYQCRMDAQPSLLHVSLCLPRIFQTFRITIQQNFQAYWTPQIVVQLEVWHFFDLSWFFCRGWV